MKTSTSPAPKSRFAKARWPVLGALVAVLLLTGCPPSKLPDAPPSVPQPKAALHLFHHSFEI